MAANAAVAATTVAANAAVVATTVATNAALAATKPQLQPQVQQPAAKWGALKSY